MSEYHLLKQGDIIRPMGMSGAESMGIVVEILEHGQVQVFWPISNKTSKHGKKWAELNFELVEYEDPN